MRSENLIIFRENSKWFRYILLFMALIFAVLLFDLSKNALILSIKGYALLSGLVLFLFSGIVFKTHVLVFDLGKRSFDICTGTFRGESLKSFSIDSIKDIVELRHATTYESTTGRTVPSAEWRLYLQMDNEQIAIPAQRFNTQDEARTAALDLANRIGLKNFPTSTEDQVVTLIRSGNKLDAISFVRELQGISLEEATNMIEKIMKKKGSS